MKLYCDNKATINIAHNLVQHDRTKHVEVDRHFIKEKLSSGAICIPFVKTGDQVADVLTKGIGSRPFHTVLGKLGIRDIFYQLKGSVESYFYFYLFFSYLLTI